MTKTDYLEVITAHWRDLIDWQNPNDALRLQMVCDPREKVISPQERADPTDDACNQVAPNLIHRYPHKVLYLVTDRCVANCRFCFRRATRAHLIPVSNNSLRAVRDYLSAQAEIKELIFSGGDPLTLTAAKWQEIVAALVSIKHIKIWRLHTRLPVFAPELVTKKLLSPLKALGMAGKKVKVVLHLNHPAEIDVALEKALNVLREEGWELMAQGVLLKNINDCPQTLASLWRRETAVGITPYYLHHPDRALGTGHFWLPLKQGLMIYRQARRLAREVPVLPKYILDLGKNGKAEVQHLRLVK